MLLATRDLRQLMRCQRAGVPLIVTRQVLWQQLVTARRQEVRPRLLLRRRQGLTVLQSPVRRRLIRTLARPLSQTVEKLQARLTALSVETSHPSHRRSWTGCVLTVSHPRPSSVSWARYVVCTSR